MTCCSWCAKDMRPIEGSVINHHPCGCAPSRMYLAGVPMDAGGHYCATCGRLLADRMVWHACLPGLVRALVEGGYRIEIANKIERGRAVGTDYVVTRRGRGLSAILATLPDRVAAEEWIAKQADPGTTW